MTKITFILGKTSKEKVFAPNNHEEVFSDFDIDLANGEYLLDLIVKLKFNGLKCSHSNNSRTLIYNIFSQ